MSKKITQEQIDKIIEDLIEKMEKANELFLTNIGESIKKIRDIKPSDAHKLVQILKYGGNYEEIVKKISKVANMNIDKIDEIFTTYSKKDQLFDEQFYNYRNIPFVEYNKNNALKKQTEAIANMVKKEMYDYTRQNVLGYSIRNDKGDLIFQGLRDVYNNALDEALMNVGQGKDTFNSAMRSILLSIGQSGLKTIDYASGRSVRLDSTIRMHLKNRLNELHNENQQLFGQEFGADGIEISVHDYPAPDHELSQGRQFSNEEFDKLQDGLEAKDYKGVTYSLDHDGKNGYRPIGEMNCYHTIFSIVLGVSEPEYSEEQLQEIIQKNEDGFEFEGKKYTMYEGTQLQRQIEREIRKQKDLQILGRASDNTELISAAQSNITLLGDKYKELSNVSGLPSKKQRLSVSGYHRLKRYDNPIAKPSVDLKYSASEHREKSFLEWKEHFAKKYGSYDIFNGRGDYYEGQSDYVSIDKSIGSIDDRLIDRNLSQYEYLVDKYNVIDEHGLNLIAEQSKRKAIGWEQSGSRITLNKKYFDSKEKLEETMKRSKSKKWINEVKDKDLDIYVITHEYGHIVEDNFIDIRRDTLPVSPRISRAKIDSMFRDEILSRTQKRTGLSRTEIKQKYFSGYAKSKRNYEWFAEGFADYELGVNNPFSQELGRWIEENRK